MARASLEELLEDYKDYLRTRDLAIWEKDSKPAMAVRQLSRQSGSDSYELYRPYIEERSNETGANMLICLINQTNYLLDKQIRQQEESFLANGGLKEIMYKARTKARARGNWQK